MARTSTFYSTAFVAILSAYVAACGGGGGDAAPTTIDEAQEPAKVYAPTMDYLLPVPPEWGPSDAAFAVLMRGNFVEKS